MPNENSNEMARGSVWRSHEVGTGRDWGMMVSAVAPHGGLHEVHEE